MVVWVGLRAGKVGGRGANTRSVVEAALVVEGFGLVQPVAAVGVGLDTRPKAHEEEVKAETEGHGFASAG